MFVQTIIYIESDIEMYIWLDCEGLSSPVPDDEQHTQHPERQCKVATHCTMTERCCSPVL